ncbi:MAG: agmatinase [bacterium]|nr:agmatinase [bacterium]
MGKANPFLGADYQARFEDARAVVLPVPFEATVSYGGGTARGPSAILEASAQIEVRDEVSGSQAWKRGIFTEAVLELAGHTVERVLDTVTERVGRVLDAGKWPIMLGGEHSITPAAVAAVAKRHPGLTLVQLDAHADLRDSYEGQRHSHACAMARSLDHVESVNAVGIRSYSPEEAERIRDGIPGYRILHGHELGASGWIERALDGVDGKPVYLTVDVDYFDPAVIPSTGTPEPGGGEWWPTLTLLEELFRRSNVVACDVVELAPIHGIHHADFTVARLVYKLIGLAPG